MPFLDEEGLKHLWEKIEEKGATKLQKPVKINGIEFDGTKDVSLDIPHKKLIWENASPYSAFGANVISLPNDFSSYDGIEIIHWHLPDGYSIAFDDHNNTKISLNDGIRSTGFIPKDQSFRIEENYFKITGSQAVNFNYEGFRHGQFFERTGELSISDGVGREEVSGGFFISNWCCVPLYVYAVKI